jgi:hypothetical protein
MRTKAISFFLLAITLGVTPAFAGKIAQNKPQASRDMHRQGPAFDPESRQILLNMCDFMKSLQEFSFKAEVTHDELSTRGEMLQYSFDLETYVRRPDKLRVNGDGDLVNKQFIFDGKAFTLYDKNANVYAVADAPADIEGALDKAHKEFDLTVALADLTSADLCEHVAGRISNGVYAGIHKVRGVPAHHFAFDKDGAHFQIWVQTGDKPLIRKILITREGAAHPQWSANISDWNLDAKLPDNLFAFAPPEGADKIEFARVQTARVPVEKHRVVKKKGDRT